ncbi:MAG TPA: hypothetical protein VGM79_07315 [Streptosporangiaceae bacterium]|jgi:hypothetical protein
MTDQDEEPAAEFHRNRREHGGASARPDDDRLARLTEEERVEVGLDAYDPDEVPDAEDGDPVTDVTQTDVYEEEQAEIRHEVDKDELAVEGEEKRSFPPTRYDRS